MLKNYSHFLIEQIPEFLILHLELNAKLSRNDNPPLPDRTIYCRLVGSLIYLTMTHPDISHVIQVVSQFAIVEGLVIEGSLALLLPP